MLFIWREIPLITGEQFLKRRKNFVEFELSFRLIESDIQTLMRYVTLSGKCLVRNWINFWNYSCFQVARFNAGNFEEWNYRLGRNCEGKSMKMLKIVQCNRKFAFLARIGQKYGKTFQRKNCFAKICYPCGFARFCKTKIILMPLEAFHCLSLIYRRKFFSKTQISVFQPWKLIFFVFQDK